MISSKSNSYSSEAALKYFLIQALGSVIILIRATSITLSPLKPGLVIISALLLKIGAAPLHFWFPPIMQGISWTQCILLITVQKVAPLALVSYTLVGQTPATILQAASIISALAGGIGGLNQTLLRKILAYSSINHIGWILAALILRGDVWLSYIFIYSLVSSSVVALLNANRIFHFKQLASIPDTKVKILAFFRLFSLGGLPPFLGFIPKLLVIKLLALSGNPIWLGFLLAGSLITLFYYLQVVISTLTLSTPKLKFPDYVYSSKSPYLARFINLSPLFLAPLSIVQT